MNDESASPQILQRIRQAEQELNQAISEWRAVTARARKRAGHFSKEVRAAQKRLRRSLWKQISSAGVLFWITAPVIYALIVPLALLDVSATIFQIVCFPVYGIDRVRRSDYVVMDRHRLSYLNALEKINCVYCGYGNGVIAYVREIASRTEQFFCPIKHALAVPGTHTRYSRFAAYGDAKEFRELLGKTDQETKETNTQGALNL